MRSILIYLAERLARDPALRARLHAALNALGRSNGRGPPSGDLTIDHAGSGSSRQVSQEALQREPGDGGRARNLIWMLGSGLLLLWVLLVAGAYGLWAIFGDSAITQAADISRSVGQSEVAGPIAAVATFVRDLVGPVLAVIGVAVSAVILIVTALAARLLGRRTQG